MMNPMKVFEEGGAEFTFRVILPELEGDGRLPFRFRLPPEECAQSASPIEW